MAAARIHSGKIRPNGRLGPKHTYSAILTELHVAHLQLLVEAVVRVVHDHVAIRIPGDVAARRPRVELVGIAIRAPVLLSRAASTAGNTSTLA